MIKLEDRVFCLIFPRHKISNLPKHQLPPNNNLLNFFRFRLSGGEIFLFICFIASSRSTFFLCKVASFFLTIFSPFIVCFWFLKSCADTKVTNKTLFPTFARTSLGPPEKISKSVIALLKAYQWKKFIIVADTRQWTKEITLAVKVNKKRSFVVNDFNWLQFQIVNRIWRQKTTWT